MHSAQLHDIAHSCPMVAQPRLRDEIGACHITAEKVLEEVVCIKAQLRKMAARFLRKLSHLT